MQPHQERVVIERDELAEKVQKLGVFLDGDIFKSLDPKEQGRLFTQQAYMTLYLEVLGQRIAAF